MRLDPARVSLDGSGLSLAECYELCARVQREHSKTYHFATRLFPGPVRRHVYALYAFMRYADELVDNPGTLTLEEQGRALDEFEAETFRAISGEPVENPVLRAYAGTVRECGIEAEDIRAFLASMKMDTHTFRYRTFEDLEGYTYGSAAVVGIMMCRVVGVRDERARPHAEALGTAMQLTNFLRDIGEDWRRGRVYVPLEDLERFGYTESDLARAVIDERFERLVRFESERARELYGVADAGMKYIPEGRRYPVVVARELYAEILTLIEKRRFDVFSGRARTTLARKLALAGACAAREPGTILARARER
ncbi:Phytoene/squalene synthetase [Rubrobacter radiotolerans]|uniref:Phytoene/squalene synthase family protein n=1 Tax=Rubrobacter radiotolerans TaxID=42256 RepID=A0A023X1U2_RUBRA|nr:phytoene/squalene synthase family protein [Rubrobacter radiotolerans]AHY46014.1 Phytoene/squalene synthetase [Rubrobacter radiotolerans]MDX5893426.1 phytoene/squalene synthase family protein [Rubrobacter radiotolerans]SMC03710.1 phytoene synthase [Rubrobacter radiotolerans DSM 5868]